nr:cytochrome c oxidase subunit 2 [Begonia coptidifolia]
MPKDSHDFLGWTNRRFPTSLSFFFGGGAEQSKKKPNKMIVLKWLFLTIAPCDAAEPWQLGSQDAATPMMQGIIDLHHDIFFFLFFILVFVSRILVRALWHFHYEKKKIPQRIVHGTTIEILWTIFPSIIPMFIAIPSFALLYSMDEVVVDPAITIKAIGHQWYRTYEYSDYNSSDEQSLTFDSYTIPEDDLELGQSRLLEVDNRVVVPAKTHLRIIVTPADVPHSLAVPSSGVKCDAVPGRLNQISILVQREGVYYGQCSEICGTNHAFTPIVVEAVPRKDYGSRVSNQLIPKTVEAFRVFIASPIENGIFEVPDESSIVRPDLELRLGRSSLPVPYLSEAARRGELFEAMQRLVSKGFFAKTEQKVVEAYLQLEIQLESALRANGYTADSIFHSRGEWRSVAFLTRDRYIHTRDKYLSLTGIIKILSKFENQMEKSNNYQHIINGVEWGKIQLKKD